MPCGNEVEVRRYGFTTRLSYFMKHYLGIPLKLVDFKITHWLFWQNEWWKDIPGYERLYAVSTLGRVRSFDRFRDGLTRGTKCKIFSAGRILKLQTRRNGYKWAMLYKDSKSKCCNVHRLIISTFFDKSEKLVNHKDLNKGNNKLSNLEYCTPRENCVHFLQTVQTVTDETGITFRKKKRIYDVRITHLSQRWKLIGTIDKSLAIKVKNLYFDIVLNCKTKEEVRVIKTEIQNIYKK